MALPDAQRRRLYVAPTPRGAPSGVAELFDLRCVECTRLLLRYQARNMGATIDIKCHRCGTIQQRTLSGPLEESN